MALSPELKLMVSGAQTAVDPSASKREEILKRQADAERELAQIEEDFESAPSIREQLALIGLHKATKAELREIILDALIRDPNV